MTNTDCAVPFCLVQALYVGQVHCGTVGHVLCMQDRCCKNGFDFSFVF